MAATDSVNRGTSGVNIPAEVSAEVLAKAATTSAFLQAGRKVDLPGHGAVVHTLTGDPEPDFVEETEKKPVSKPTISNQVLKGKTIAVIVPFSRQLLRDGAALYDAIADRIPSAFASRIDKAISGAGTAPSGFGTLASAPSVGIAGKTYNGLVAAYQSVATGGGLPTAWVMSPQGTGTLLGAADTTGRPLLLGNVATDGPTTSILGLPVYNSNGVYMADADGAGSGTVAQLGYTGDFSQLIYGYVEDLRVDISEHATITVGGSPVSMFETNQVAIRFEVELGVVVNSPSTNFARLTSAVQS